MCGIAGRIRYDGGAVGADIVHLSICMRHRGPDSTGFAIYGERRESGYVVRGFLDDRARLDASLQQIVTHLKDCGSDLTADPTWDEAGQAHVLFRMEIAELKDLSTWVDRVESIPGVELLSVGRSLEVIKDVGDAREVDAKHHVSAMNGTHALVNNRMATESLVTPNASHPFWARPFPDVCIVHNGQLTNYYKWRRQLEREGYRFGSDNDSELIAVWDSVQMSKGLSLQESLKRSQSELDGVFTYLLGTADGISMAKDRWAIKPLAVVDEADGVAIATEEQALRSLYRNEVEVINYDGPLMTEIWGLKAQLKEAA
ncbi:MAG: glutamine amidotransferase [Nevskiaceae bacterium]|nr:MAG: glutamine amidotransferase [Nevskiaceae bacterium]TBR73720.1 MAG: glutamine amidotransferase [Nevskiaceae bacterium]